MRLTVTLADFTAADLAADRLGQFVDKLDYPRVFVGGRDLLDVVLQFMDQGRGRLKTLGQHDCSLDNLAAHRIRRRSNGTFQDGRMLLQGAFDLEGADPVAGTLDDVIGTADEPVIAVLVAPGDVAGLIQAVVPDPAGCFLVPVIAAEQAWRQTVVKTADDNPALGTGRAGFAIFIDDVDLVERGRLAN